MAKFDPSRQPMRIDMFPADNSVITQLVIYAYCFYIACLPRLAL